MSLRVSKTLSAAQRSTDSRPRTCLSTRERQKASDERTTTNGEDILRSEESAHENWGGRRFHTGVMLFADKIRGKGRRGYFLQLRFRSAGTPACARHRLRTPFASRRARDVRLLSLTLILKNQYRSSSCPRRDPLVCFVLIFLPLALWRVQEGGERERVEA